MEISLAVGTRILFSRFSRSGNGIGFRNFLVTFRVVDDSEPTDVVKETSLEFSPPVGRLMRFDGIFSRRPRKPGRSFFGDSFLTSDAADEIGVCGVDASFAGPLRNSLKV
jgi:hypothetical protein